LVRTYILNFAMGAILHRYVTGG